jgi:pyrrolidone-carboxylate peptidase
LEGNGKSPIEICKVLKSGISPFEKRKINPGFSGQVVLFVHGHKNYDQKIKHLPAVRSSGREGLAVRGKRCGL